MLEFKNVYFKYPNTKDDVLKDVTLKVEQGSWLTIIGKNGSGKSTLMKLIYGEHVATSGQIYLDGLEYDKSLLDKIYNDVAVVFQNPENQFIASTVEEDIAFGLENRNIPSSKMKEIIDNVLDIVDMKDYKYFEPSSLSGGQKQRVAIASSLALKPKILILDEATSMLDPKARENILTYIKKINKEQNLTIISITHDVKETSYADKIVIIDDGKIEYLGTYFELYSDKKLIEKYHLELPFVEKFKQDLNDYFKQDMFSIEDNEDDVVKKICELVLKT